MNTVIFYTAPKHVVGTSTSLCPSFDTYDGEDLDDLVLGPTQDATIVKFDFKKV
jgi:hypothetical protein